MRDRRGKVLRARPLLKRRRRGAPLLLAASWLVTLVAWYAAVTIPRTAGKAGSVEFILPLAAAAVAPLLLRAAWRRCRVRGRRLSLLVPVAAAALFVTGWAVQHQVDGIPVPVWSELHEALELHETAEDDLELLRLNQELLGLPRAQGLPILEAYAAAAEASLEVAGRWNPATRAASDLPGSGFGPVQAELNEVATMQADALVLYADDLRAPQEAVAERAARLRDTVAARIDGAGGLADLIAGARSSSVALLRR